MVCPACISDVPDDDLFCENCGVALAEPEPQNGTQPGGCTCGAPVDETDEDGFCLRCGKRVRRPPSDHLEEALSSDFAAVSDRGLRHDRNEDRFALVQEGSGFALVVCDGVSATSNAEVAAGTVAETIAQALRAVLREGPVLNGQAAVMDAIAAATAELRESSGSGAGENAPSTTAVVALVIGDEITVGWVGDSRAYWVDYDGAKPLTRDHSWVNAVLDEGEMTEEEALAAPQAHAITRWMGADAEAAAVPDVAQHTITQAGTLLLCTDGLWNYAPHAEMLSELLLSGGREDSEDSLEVARRIVAFANEQGGRDNVTVALLRLQRDGEADV